MVALTKTTKRMLARAASRAPIAAAHALVIARIGSDPWRKIDRIDRELRRLPQAKTPLQHVFTAGLYQRTICVQAGLLITSRVHLTEHPFVISMGVVSVWCDDSGWEIFEGVHTGVTKPATRRVLYTHSDTVWTTTHANPDDERDIDVLEKRLFYDHHKLLLKI